MPGEEIIPLIGAGGGGIVGGWMLWKINEKLNNLNREVGETKQAVKAHKRAFENTQSYLQRQREVFEKHIKENNDIHTEILIKLQKLNGR